MCRSRQLICETVMISCIVSSNIRAPDSGYFTGHVSCILYGLAPLWLACWLNAADTFQFCFGLSDFSEIVCVYLQFIDYWLWYHICDYDILFGCVATLAVSCTSYWWCFYYHCKSVFMYCEMSFFIFRSGTDLISSSYSCCSSSFCWGDLSKKTQDSVVSNRIGMKFGMIVLQVNMLP